MKRLCNAYVCMLFETTSEKTKLQVKKQVLSAPGPDAKDPGVWLPCFTLFLVSIDCQTPRTVAFAPLTYIQTPRTLASGPLTYSQTPRILAFGSLCI